MDIIREKKNYTGIGYVRYLDNKKLFEININGFRKIYNDYEYLLLLDSNGNVIEDAYNYLNVELNEESLKQRERCFVALKLLYSYMGLFYIIDIKEFDNKELNRFISFLKGGIRSNESLLFDGYTVRSNSTINNYIGVYRKYFKYLNIDNVFDEKYCISKIKGGTGFFAHTKKYKVEKYSISRKTFEREEVPPYIGFDEYEQIINFVRENYSVREELIIKLMYEYGMRIGEVLGITLEDIVDKRYSKSGVNEIEIRNRFTDKPWQGAKGCMSIKSRSCYQEPEYYKKGCKDAGYQVIEITNKTKQLIDEYLGEFIYYPFISKKLKSNLHNKNIADKVKEENNNELNCYIFVSKNLTPITVTGWNRILKNIFLETGISVDSKVKKDGLNHRFRHGFAMFKVLIEDYDELRLQRALRHSNPLSCRAYFKPTKSDLKKFELIKKRLLNRGGITLD